ncbi:MAG: NAD kinase [Paludibacteraceae bacterium]|nr:NAD kinase [Paludibacteraceae bacterium]
MKVAIFGNTHRQETISTIKELLLFLSQEGIQAVLDDNIHRVLSQEHFPLPITAMQPQEEADWALSVGGDGTFLTTAAAVGQRMPIIGLNTGRLGFLADVSPDDMREAFAKLLAGHYALEQRSLLEVKAENVQLALPPHALNEVALLKQDLSSMISVSVYLDGQFLHTYQADGLMVATPTGSTAYALSVGGPILTPQTQNFILAPVATHSLNVRPMVIADDTLIELHVKSRSNSFLLSVDGQSQVLNDAVKITLKKAPYTVQTIRIDGHSFFQTLKTKLMWGADKRL